jgi:hypothetical protein
MPVGVGSDILGPVTTGAKVPNGGTVSAGFSVPIQAGAMTIVVPTSVDAGTWKLQVRVPIGSYGDAETWVDAWYWDPGAAAAGQIKQIISAVADVNRAVVIPGPVLPGGFLRIVMSATATADRQFYVYFYEVQR